MKIIESYIVNQIERNGPKSFKTLREVFKLENGEYVIKIQHSLEKITQEQFDKLLTNW